jgi:hypothetical protein
MFISTLRAFVRPGRDGLGRIATLCLRAAGGKSRFRRSDPLFNKPTTKVVFLLFTEFIEYGGRIDTGEIQSVAWMTPAEVGRDLACRAALHLTDSLAWGSTASSDRRARCCRTYQETRGIPSGAAPGPKGVAYARVVADSLLEGGGFELVWGFSCQVVVLVLLPVLCSEREKPFFVPSPAIRFAARAEGVKGPKH